MDSAFRHRKPMVQLIPLILVVLAGCSTEPDADVAETKTADTAEQHPSTDIEKTSEPKRPPLDLSMPENIGLADPENIEPLDSPSYKFDAKPLFEQKDKDDELSVTVIPSFETSDEALALPRLDGGSVSVEVKTK